ncbi:uncharacterized protein IL334_000847 [Kwoniella shivajii]|uniref:Post-SET domain-containing protein n=1 Tax=Kwoniella shivajii TaxID=564305 RepID=A0ABZ1CRW0_9TREE|nr:hypothetical protein IL334_000847 [Kwoniella shivajii]
MSELTNDQLKEKIKRLEAKLEHSRKDVRTIRNQIQQDLEEARSKHDEEYKRAMSLYRITENKLIELTRAHSGLEADTVRYQEIINGLKEENRTLEEQMRNRNGTSIVYDDIKPEIPIIDLVDDEAENQDDSGDANAFQTETDRKTVLINEDSDARAQEDDDQDSGIISHSSVARTTRSKTRQPAPYGRPDHRETRTSKQPLLQQSTPCPLPAQPSPDPPLNSTTPDRPAAPSQSPLINTITTPILGTPGSSGTSSHFVLPPPLPHPGLPQNEREWEKWLNQIDYTHYHCSCPEDGCPGRVTRHRSEGLPKYLIEKSSTRKFRINWELAGLCDTTKCLPPKLVSPCYIKRQILNIYKEKGSWDDLEKLKGWWSPGHEKVAASEHRLQELRYCEKLNRVIWLTWTMDIDLISLEIPQRSYDHIASFLVSEWARWYVLADTAEKNRTAVCFRGVR